MHIKKLLLTHCFIAGSLLGAQNVSAHNAVKLTDGDLKETILLLSHGPIVSINGNVITVETDKERIECELEGNPRFEFLDYDDAGIDAPEYGSLTFHFDSNSLKGENLKPGTQVCIVDLSGRILTVKVADAMGSVNLDISTLPVGVYIFKTNDQIYKFYKK